jgi:hypothetical protein
MHTGAAVGKVVDDGLQFVVFTRAVAPQVRPMCFAEALIIGTSVSSACRTGRVRSIARIA